MALVVAIFGPVAAGKTEVARTLKHLDLIADNFDLRILRHRIWAWRAQPATAEGWLGEYQRFIDQYLRDDTSISIEQVGSSDLDWILTDRLKNAGHPVVQVWVTAPDGVILSRLRERNQATAQPVEESEVKATWVAADRQARRRQFDYTIDTAHLSVDELSPALAPLVSRLRAMI